MISEIRQQDISIIAGGLSKEDEKRLAEICDEV